MSISVVLREIEALQKGAETLLAESLRRIAAAEVRDQDERKRAAEADVALLVGNAMVYADILGRSVTFREMDRAMEQAPVKEVRDMQTGRFAAAFQTSLKIKPVAVKFGAFDFLRNRRQFLRAVRDLLRREPRIAQDPESIARVYRDDAFAVAKTSSIEVTQRVQKAIGDQMRKGAGALDAAEAIREVGNWTSAYSETVYRTNVKTAAESGRQQQARDPAVALIMPAFEFQATGDGDTRPNHQNAHGLLAATTDPVWGRFTPPLGFNCRCIRRLVSRFELERRNLLIDGARVVKVTPPRFAAAFPDPGFGALRNPYA